MYGVSADFTQTVFLYLCICIVYLHVRNLWTLLFRSWYHFLLKNIALVGSICKFDQTVFVYLCFCICVIVYLCICVIVYVFVFLSWWPGVAGVPHVYSFFSPRLEGSLPPHREPAHSAPGAPAPPPSPAAAACESREQATPFAATIFCCYFKCIQT